MIIIMIIIIITFKWTHKWKLSKPVYLLVMRTFPVDTISSFHNPNLSPQKIETIHNQTFQRRWLYIYHIHTMCLCVCVVKNVHTFYKASWNDLIYYVERYELSVQYKTHSPQRFRQTNAHPTRRQALSRAHWALLAVDTPRRLHQSIRPGRLDKSIRYSDY